jgi:hypothetical protein
MYLDVLDRFNSESTVPVIKVLSGLVTEGRYGNLYV